MTDEVPDTTTEILNRAAAMAENDDFSSAIALLQEAIDEIAGDDARTHDLARLYAFRGDLEKPRSCVDAAEAYFAAIERFELVETEETSDDHFGALDSLVTELLHLERSEDALEVAEKFLARALGAGDDERLMTALVRRGRALNRCERFTEALEDLRRARFLSNAVLDRTDDRFTVLQTIAEAETICGDALYSLDRRGEAAASLSNAVEAHRRLCGITQNPWTMLPDHGAVARRLGDELEAAGRCVEAAAAYDQAVSLLTGADDPRCRLELARALGARAASLIHVQRVGEAEMAATESLELFEDLGREYPETDRTEMIAPLENLAAARQASGDCEGSAEAFRRLIEVHSAHEHEETGAEHGRELRGHLALELVHLGELPQAIEIFEEILPPLEAGIGDSDRSRGLLATWFDALGEAYEQTGESEKAAFVKDRARTFRDDEDDPESVGNDEASVEEPVH